MNKKFMRVIIIAIPVLTAIIIASQLMHAPVTDQDGTLGMIQNSEQIEIEIAIPKDEYDTMIEEEMGTEAPLTWVILAELDTYQDTLRVQMDKKFNTIIDKETGNKLGKLYFNKHANSIQNNTLLNALSNSSMRQYLKNDYIIEAMSEIALNTYADLDEGDTYTNALMALNGYYNLLPDNEPNYANPNTTLTRAELMALIMRAETPVDDTITADENFKAAVGDSKYNIYAQFLVEDSYISTTDKSLTSSNYDNGAISRVEAIYMLMNHFYGDELKNFDASQVKLKDATDGGDIAIEQGYTGKDGAAALTLKYALNNPDEGLPTDLYKALAFARSKGFVSSTTEWDSGLTRAEALELYVSVATSGHEVKTDDSKDSKVENFTWELDNGVHNRFPSYYYLSDGSFDEAWEESGLTWSEDAEDCWVGFEEQTNPDGTGKLVYYKDGSEYYAGDILPDGSIYQGNAVDKQIKKDYNSKVTEYLFLLESEEVSSTYWRDALKGLLNLNKNKVNSNEDFTPLFEDLGLTPDEITIANQVYKEVAAEIEAER